jgi:sugar phosphate isomerase/epimerase
MMTRREFGKLSFAGLAVAARPEGLPLPVALVEHPTAAGHGLQTVPSSVVNGVHLGVQTYSFRELPRPAGAADAADVVIDAMRTCGLTECELYSPQIEPAGKSRQELRAWRIETPIDHFRAIRKRFDAAGIRIYAFNYSPGSSYTDEEIERGFEIASALGAAIVTSSTQLDTARRIAPLAEKHRMVVAMHGHSNVKDANQLATPQSFAAAMKMSKYFKINLDIGHFTAAGFDAVPFIQEHHADITNLHIKDMKRNVPESYVPWGTGDAPIRDVLQLLKRERWPIRAYLEYEYAGASSPVEETTRCFAYMKRALA